MVVWDLRVPRLFPLVRRSRIRATYNIFWKHRKDQITVSVSTKREAAMLFLNRVRCPAVLASVPAQLRHNSLLLPEAVIDRCPNLPRKKPRQLAGAFPLKARAADHWERMRKLSDQSDWVWQQEPKPLRQSYFSINRLKLNKSNF